MVFGPPTRRESERRGFEDLVEKAGGLSITREQKQLLLKKLNEEIESTQKKFIESKGLPKEVFAALDAEYADFSEKLGNAAGQVVKEAIEGRLDLPLVSDALYRTTDTDAIDSFGEAKVKLDEKATELLTDVRSFHLAIVDGDVAQHPRNSTTFSTTARASPSWTNWRFSQEHTVEVAKPSPTFAVR